MGMQQPPQSQNLMNNQQGNQVQGMMVQYPAMSSYQVPMTQGSQGLPQQSYQQPIMLPNQSACGAVPGMPYIVVTTAGYKPRKLTWSMIAVLKVWSSALTVQHDTF
ncbi:hypothetical protein Y1Q_0017575 [Alligator mississippiensis]|uniref:Uncharacterized protein n=1 Tax=Alligator mississippiensis TaxID=8496 RepID=A0A151P2H7_ALLMI|nr:hypothetical protein Y1Q_0017575 [Alligator mississippiensis]